MKNVIDKTEQQNTSEKSITRVISELYQTVQDLIERIDNIDAELEKLPLDTRSDIETIEQKLEDIENLYAEEDHEHGDDYAEYDHDHSDEYVTDEDLNELKDRIEAIEDRIGEF